MSSSKTVTINVRHKASSDFIGRFFCTEEERENVVKQGIARYCVFFKIDPPYDVSSCDITVEEEPSNADNTPGDLTRAASLVSREEALRQRELATQERKRALELREAALKKREAALATRASEKSDDGTETKNGDVAAESGDKKEDVKSTNEEEAKGTDKKDKKEEKAAEPVVKKDKKKKSAAEADAQSNVPKTISLVPNPDGEWPDQNLADMRAIPIEKGETLALGRNDTTGITFAKLGRQQASITRSNDDVLTVERLGKNPSWLLKAGAESGAAPTALTKNEKVELKEGGILLLLKQKFPYRVKIAAVEVPAAAAEATGKRGKGKKTKGKK